MKIKVLITVKTYPNLSTKYEEIVCTAGITEEGKWIRIYPVKFREIPYDKQYKKYDWIEIDLIKNKSDFRPETFNPRSHDSEFKFIKHIGTENEWKARKEIVLKNVITNFNDLLIRAKNKKDTISLAVYKPTKIIDFKWTEVTREWDSKKILKLNQLNLFESKGNVVRKLPYKFLYIFEDENGRQRTLMIEDWEIGQLYWNLLFRYKGDEDIALKKVKEKYYDEFVNKKDLHLFLGTTREHHFTSRNPFMIIGIFYPPKMKNEELF